MTQTTWVIHSRLSCKQNKWAKRKELKSSTTFGPAATKKRQNDCFSRQYRVNKKAKIGHHKHKTPKKSYVCRNTLQTNWLCSCWNKLFRLHVARKAEFARSSNSFVGTRRKRRGWNFNGGISLHRSSDETTREKTQPKSHTYTRLAVRDSQKNHEKYRNVSITLVVGRNRCPKITDEWIVSNAEIVLRRENGNFRMESVTVSQRPPSIPHGLQWKRTRGKKLVTKYLTTARPATAETLRLIP